MTLQPRAGGCFLRRRTIKNRRKSMRWPTSLCIAGDTLLSADPVETKTAFDGELSNLLAENLVHDLGAASQGRHDLVPVHHLSRRGLIMPSQERDRLHWDAVGR